jgi:hypothetical protein
VGAQPVRGYRGVINGGLRNRLVTLPAGGDGRPPGDLSRRLSCLVWCAGLAAAGELGAGGCRRGRTRHGAAGHGVTEGSGRRPVFYCAGRADEPDQELIGAYETDRRPGRDHRPDQTVGPALGHVRREGRRDPQAEQAAGQGGYRDRCRAAYSITIELA